MSGYFKMIKTLYHGTDANVTVLKPLGVDMGMIFQKPQWAIYFWDNYLNAFRWAVFQTARRIGTVKLMYHIPTGKFMVKDVDVSKLNAVIGKTCYVYRTKANLGDYRYGSSPDIQEYTINRDVVPDLKVATKITEQVLNDSVIVVTQLEWDQYITQAKAGKFKSRNILFSLVMDPTRDLLRHKYHAKIQSGELKPGDDLSKVALESIPPSQLW